VRKKALVIVGMKGKGETLEHPFAPGKKEAVVIAASSLVTRKKGYTGFGHNKKKVFFRSGPDQHRREKGRRVLTHADPGKRAS